LLILIIADIKKSIKVAQRGNLVMKRKLRDKASELYEGELFLVNGNIIEVGGNCSENGVINMGCLGDVDIKFFTVWGWRRLVSSHADHNDNFKIELRGAWEPLDSS
jgi:hypothetical protein